MHIERNNGKTNWKSLCYFPIYYLINNIFEWIITENKSEFKSYRGDWT